MEIELDSLLKHNSEHQCLDVIILIHIFIFCDGFMIGHVVNHFADLETVVVIDNVFENY